ncbi:ATP-grasp domain-containing protein [Burkholderia sp. F1]|uniref:ATP-grasp domain-containing protein n=1 Tax=Burkholderia sp. F1 TaxID=3366817 RepID=UPI003D73B392
MSNAVSAADSGITVAVTGVGAIIGQGIINSLRRSGRRVRIVGVDRSRRSPAPYLVDVFEQKPDVDERSPAYVDFWQHIIKTHGIQLIMPGLESDAGFFHQHRQVFQSGTASVVLNSADLIDATADKWIFGQRLAAIGYPAIPSLQPREWAEAVNTLGPPPLLLKPLRGNGSRGIVVLEDERDFAYWKHKTQTEWMLQRIVGQAGEEYTVAVFGLGEGRVIGPLILRRKLSTAGNTQEAEVVLDHPVIARAVNTLVQHFQPVGPTNLQFRIEGETAWLLEINPRFSSSNSLRTAFGFNEAAMAIDYYLFNQTPGTPNISTGIGWRYAEDYVIHDRDTV